MFVYWNEFCLLVWHVWTFCLADRKMLKKTRRELLLRRVLAIFIIAQMFDFPSGWLGEFTG